MSVCRSSWRIIVFVRDQMVESHHIVFYLFPFLQSRHMIKKITYTLSRLYSPGINCTSNFVNILPVKYLYERRTTNERDKSTVLNALVRAYERGVQPVHRSGTRRAKNGPMNLWRAHSHSHRRFILIFHFLGIFSTQILNFERGLSLSSAHKAVLFRLANFLLETLALGIIAKHREGEQKFS